MSPSSAGRCERTSGRLRAAIGLAALLVVANSLYQHALWSMVDFAVYRAGGTHLSHGHSLYAAAAGLPFTYPPFAAVLFLPFGWVGVGLGQAIMIVVSLGCYLAFVMICARHSALTREVTVLVVLTGLLFEPVLHTIGLGQINLVLDVFIAVDCLVIGGRWRGVLVGVAIGIKLTPAVFLLFFMMQRDIKAVVRAGIGLLATIAVAWAVDPTDSRRYWTKVFYDPGHVGRVGYPFNQSIYGTLARLTHTTAPSVALYGALAVAVTAVSIAAARRQLTAGRRVAALVVVALCGLLVSPVSWTHHWIWLLPASWSLIQARRRVLGSLVACVAILGPLWYIPTPKDLTELHLSWWQTCLSLTYTSVGLLFLVAMALPSRSEAVGEASTTAPRTETGWSPEAPRC